MQGPKRRLLPQIYDSNTINLSNIPNAPQKIPYTRLSYNKENPTKFFPDPNVPLSLPNPKSEKTIFPKENVKPGDNNEPKQFNSNSLKTTDNLNPQSKARQRSKSLRVRQGTHDKRAENQDNSEGIPLYPPSSEGHRENNSQPCIAEFRDNKIDEVDDFEYFKNYGKHSLTHSELPMFAKVTPHNYVLNGISSHKLEGAKYFDTDSCKSDSPDYTKRGSGIQHSRRSNQRVSNSNYQFNFENLTNKNERHNSLSSPRRHSHQASSSNIAAKLREPTLDSITDYNDDKFEEGGVGNSLPVSPPPIVCRVRNFSLTPQGGLINRGDSFRVKYRRQSHVPTIIPRKYSGRVSTLPGHMESLRPEMIHRRSISQDPITSDKENAQEDDYKSSKLNHGKARGERKESDSWLRNNIDDYKDDNIEGDGTATYYVLIIGGEAVGKSSILEQFTSSEYINAYEYTDREDTEDDEIKDQLGEMGIADVLPQQEGSQMYESNPADYQDTSISENSFNDERLVDSESENVARPSLDDALITFNKEKSISLTLDNTASLLIFVEVTVKEEEVFEDYYNFENEGAHGFLIVYSISDRDSFDKAINIMISLKKIHYPKAKILVGNKSDLVRAREISTEEATNAARSYGCKFIETSAGLNLNLDNLLVGILTQIRIKNSLPHNPDDRNKDCNSRISDVVMEDIMGSIKSNGQKKMKKKVKTTVKAIEIPPAPKFEMKEDAYAKGRLFGSRRAKKLLNKFFKADKRVTIGKQVSKSCVNLYS